MNISIKDKVSLVSGANRGIGRAIAVALLENGAKKVYAGARKPSTVDDLKSTYGDRLVPVRLDVTDDASIKSAAEVASDVDILFNNAGVLIPGNFLQGNLLESLRTNLDVNLWGLIKLTDAFLSSLMEREQAAIVNVSSLAGLANMPLGLTYSISKAAVHSTIQGLRGELAETNVLVTGVYPGPIDTDMAKGFEMDKDSPEKVANKIIEGLESGNSYIFPDVMSEQAGAGYMASPMALEEQFATFR